MDETLSAVVRRTAEIHELTKSQVIGVLLTQLSKTIPEEAMFATYYRMHLSFGDLALAVHFRHFQLACSCARSLFEHLLDLGRLIKSRP